MITFLKGYLHAHIPELIFVVFVLLGHFISLYFNPEPITLKLIPAVFVWLFISTSKINIFLKSALWMILTFILCYLIAARFSGAGFEGLGLVIIGILYIIIGFIALLLFEIFFYKQKVFTIKNLLSFVVFFTLAYWILYYLNLF